ncbi:hypothetical protein DL96DRAFT_1502475 [Flagelloscypha sp. PMI_526]|nr:hypothetical protein DL96DRAFT_1502475 [Flagelloscypha sp. PMI_526]
MASDSELPESKKHSLTIDLPGESVTIDLGPGQLEEDAGDIIDLLTDATPSSTVFTKLAAAYLGSGLKTAVQEADRIIKLGLKVPEGGTLQDGSGDVRLWGMQAVILAVRARTAPKISLPDVQEDTHAEGTLLKDRLYGESAHCLNGMQATLSEAADPKRAAQLAFLSRGIHQMNTRAMDAALDSFDQVLKLDPATATNLIALLGKARVFYLKKQYQQSVKLYQRVLTLSPTLTTPDPRIGIGLCFWGLGHHERAVHAFERALELNPKSSSAQSFLGLALVNLSHNYGVGTNERSGLYHRGTKLVNAAFLASANAATSNLLCSSVIKSGQWRKGVKLAERTIQCADNLPLLTEGWVKAGRVCYNWAKSLERSDPIKASQIMARAVKNFQQAVDGNKRSVIAHIGLAASQLSSGEMLTATSTLDSLLVRTNTPQPGKLAPPVERNVEVATLFLASLRAFPRPGLGPTSKELQDDVSKARTLYERAGRSAGLSPFSGNATGFATTTTLGECTQKWISNDKEMWLEIARIWWSEPGATASARTKAALEEALRVSQLDGAGSKDEDPRLINNVAVLGHLGALDMDVSTKAEELAKTAALKSAQDGYSKALGVLQTGGFGSLSSSDRNHLTSSVLYNLGRVHEELGEEQEAKEVYTKLAEHVGAYWDAKVRLANLLLHRNHHTEAHDLLKQALATEPTNLSLRAHYVKFLADAGYQKNARDFVVQSLKEHDKHDVWSLTAFGWLVYCQAREQRPTSSGSSSSFHSERKKTFIRAAELFEKALLLDPSCAYAAMGLGIITAEDALGTYMTGTMLPLAPGQQISGDEQARRLKQASRDALDVFGKVRESLQFMTGTGEAAGSGAVYLNMGHCYYSRDEFDRAVECYETYSTRFCHSQSVPGLMCLCRAWYAKAMKDQSWSIMKKAVACAQQAHHLHPADLSLLYNIAMIQQKSAEMLFALPPQKRTLKELKEAIDGAGAGQQLFASLSTNTASALPYSRDIADQRKKYGDNMLRKADEHLQRQHEFEAEREGRMEQARKKREGERQKEEEEKNRKLEQRRVEDARLAEERKAKQAEVRTWTADAQDFSDEEKEKKERKKRDKKERKAAMASDGEDDGALVEGEPKKKRSRKSGVGGRIKKRDGENGATATPVFSEDEGEDRKPAPKPRGSKKRLVRDEDEDDKAAITSAHPRKKQLKNKFKSKEMISDTDDEDEDITEQPTQPDPGEDVKMDEP